MSELTFSLPIHSRNFLYTAVQIAKDFTVLFLLLSPWKLKSLFQTKPEHMCVYVLYHVTAAAIHTYASPAENVKKQNLQAR